MRGRLERALDAYNERVYSMKEEARAPDVMAVMTPPGEARALVVGTDLDYDVFMDLAEVFAEEGMVALCAGADPVAVISGIFRAGVLIGVLHEQGGD